MINRHTFKNSVKYNKRVENNTVEDESPNPLSLRVNLAGLNALTNYSQVSIKPDFDSDTADIYLKLHEILCSSPNKLETPYSFNADEINGERIYDKKGLLCLIREYESGLIKEYYPDKSGQKIEKILEKDKSGNIVSRIEQVCKNDGSFKTNIIIFDEKINNRYTMFQVEEDGTVSSISVILDNGKNIQTVMKNTVTMLPEKYIETGEDKNGNFRLLECKFNSNCEIEEIKSTTDSKVVLIRYDGNQKIVDVRRKIPEN